VKDLSVGFIDGGGDAVLIVLYGIDVGSERQPNLEEKSRVD